MGHPAIASSLGQTSPGFDPLDLLMVVSLSLGVAKHSRYASIEPIPQIRERGREDPHRNAKKPLLLLLRTATPTSRFPIAPVEL